MALGLISRRRRIQGVSSCQKLQHRPQSHAWFAPCFAAACFASGRRCLGVPRERTGHAPRLQGRAQGPCRSTSFMERRLKLLPLVRCDVQQQHRLRRQARPPQQRPIFPSVRCHRSIPGFSGSSGVLRSFRERFQRRKHPWLHRISQQLEASGPVLQWLWWGKSLLSLATC